MEYKIVLWGYLHHTDTFSYIYYGMKKAFEYLGHQVFWFSDQEHPSQFDFDYNNCIFFVDNQGKRDFQVPINDSSIYFSYDRFTDLNKYLNKVKYLINFQVAEFAQPAADNKRYIELEKGVVYDSESTLPYYVLHFLYATDLLPSEINFENAKIIRQNEYNFVGTIHEPRPSAPPLHQDFIKIIQRENVRFNHYNPWSSPVSENYHIQYLQRSIFVPDFRPVEQKLNRYVSDRIMKAISYGCPVISDCHYAKEFIDQSLSTSENAEEIYSLGMKDQYNIEKTLHLMDVVLKNHTYLNRCKGLLNFIELKCK
jgi:hypothetical protein